jgi:hypothetical protein
MSDEKLPTQDADALGEMPEAQIEPGETNPGGADALPEDKVVEAADLDPDKNPATADDEVPDILKEGEDTETEATKEDGDEADGIEVGDDDDAKKESPA